MRLFEIICNFIKFGVADFLPNTWQTKLLKYLFFWQSKVQIENRAEGLRLFLESLGPVYIKFGQLMSVRRDLIPEDVADQLEKLQDSLPALPWSEVEPLILAGLDGKIADNFTSIDPEAIAAASIAQVHRAVLLNGKRCVIKILRPNLEVLIAKDLSLAKILIKIINLLFKQSERLRLNEILVDYEKVIYDELDLSKEAASLSQVGRNFADTDMLSVPKVYWEQSSDSILTMEEIFGVPLGKIETLIKHNVNMKLLAERGVEIFFTQVFRDNFFHADMHPGNIFVDISDPSDPKYSAVDFGIVGSLLEDDQYYLAESLLAFFNNNYSDLAKSYIRSGWVSSETSQVELESAFRTVLEPYLGKPISEISLAKILMKLFKVSGRFGMDIQPQLILLDKTLLYVEGLGRQIYPELDLWSTAKPFIESWLKQRIGIEGFLRESKSNFSEYVSSIPSAPLKLHKVLDQIVSGNLNINYVDKDLEKSRLSSNKNQRKLSNSILAVGSFIGAILLFEQGETILSSVSLIAATIFVLKS